MKRTIRCLFFCGLLILSMIASAVAEDLFEVTYEKKIVSSDESTVSGVLILHVTNVSGQDVQDVVASVSGANDVTYDNHAIMVGNLAEAQPAGVLDEFTVPAVMTEVEIPDGEPVVWNVEYTDQNGDRQEAKVEGMAIQ